MVFYHFCLINLNNQAKILKIASWESQYPLNYCCFFQIRTLLNSLAWFCNHYNLFSICFCKKTFEKLKKTTYNLKTKQLEVNYDTVGNMQMQTQLKLLKCLRVS